MTAPLTLSALSLGLAVALAQRPDGSRAAELTRIAEAPHTSVQNSLRHLVAHGFVRQSGPLFWLIADHPAASDLVNLGLRIPSPEAAIALVLRANDAVDFAFVDEIGFVVGERRADHPAAWLALDRSLTTIRRDRDRPRIVRFETVELARILRSAMGLRARLARGEPLKGLLPRPRDPDSGSRVRRS